MERAPNKNRKLVIFLGLFQLLMFIVYGAWVQPIIAGVQFQWITLLNITFCIGYLYLTNQGRPYFINIMGNWIIMFILCFQLYFLYIAMWGSIKYKIASDALFYAGILNETNLPIAMLTIAYINLKGFLNLKEVVILTLVGVFGFSCNQFLVYDELEGFDFSAVTVFMFGSLYGFTVRAIAIPTRSFSPLNKFVDLSREHALVALPVCVFFFVSIAANMCVLPSNGCINVITTICFAIMGAILMHLWTGEKMAVQTIVYVTIGSGVFILPTPDIIQNAAAPAVLGTAVGFLLSYTRKLLPRYLQTMKIPDPGLTTLLFIIPAISGNLFSAIFIAAYSSPNYNHFGQYFPYPRILLHPYKYGAMQLAVLLVSTIMAMGTGAVAGFLMKWLSEMNELEEVNLLWSEKSDRLPGSDANTALLANEFPGNDPSNEGLPISVPAVSEALPNYPSVDDHPQ